MKINIHFFIFLLITLIVVISDNLIYILNLNYIVSVLVGLIIIGILSIFLIKKKKITISCDFEMTDFVLITLVLIKLITCIAISDNSYDVRSYHIYNQEYPFVDKINFDFFPRRMINIFLYSLWDRMFYLTRFLLGFRLGTILSYYCIVVLFYQTPNLIYNILEINKSKLIPTKNRCISNIKTTIENNWNKTENSHLLNDRNFEKIHIDGTWIALGDDSMLVSLIREDGTPIYCLDIIKILKK